MKEKIILEEILQMELPPIVMMAAPIMIALVVLEWMFSQHQSKNLYHGKDTLAALVIGLGNLFISFLIKTFLFGFFILFYNIVPWSIPSLWITFILCIVWIDFWRYWAHRIAHENRFWWATHVTHHSSEKYNLSVSFRLGWTQHIKIIFFIPVVLAGFHPIVFFIANQIIVLYQFWVHTEYIKKLPKWIEFIFVTPSHHRVHHGKNPIYLDKNYGSTFIIWDRWFGTFQPETIPADYGITEPVGSYNPLVLVFHEWFALFKDVWNANSWKEAWQLTFVRPSRYTALKRKHRANKELRSK